MGKTILPEHVAERPAKVTFSPCYGPSPHLSWEELRCRDGTPYPEIWQTTRAVILGRLFEIVRFSAGGLPLTILSGYRTAAHNRAVGGARHSQHVEGRALDLAPPKTMTVREFFHIIHGLTRDVASLGGIGLYPSFVHIDCRPTYRVVVWSGHRQMADLS